MVLSPPRGPRRVAAPSPTPSPRRPPPRGPVPVCAPFFPSRLLGSRACRPPVLLAVPGEAEALLAESDGGVAARPEDLASFRAAIEPVRSDPERARAMGEAGRRFVLPRFARGAIMAELGEKVAARL